jgi:thymidine kinase
MATLGCNLQKQISALERIDALAEGSCRHCGKQAWMLQALHKRLEVCGQEFMLPIGTRGRVIDYMPLCPDCHAAHHRDTEGRHDPCPLHARAKRASSSPRSDRA